MRSHAQVIYTARDFHWHLSICNQLVYLALLPQHTVYTAISNSAQNLLQDLTSEVITPNNTS